MESDSNPVEAIRQLGWILLFCTILVTSIAAFVWWTRVLWDWAMS